jgi:hypothetical protein
MAIVALLILRHPEEGERAAARARPVAALAPGILDELEIERKGSRTDIRKDRGMVRVTVPIDFPADPTGAGAAFDAMESLQFTDLVTDRSARHAELEVDDRKGVRVIAKKGGRPLLDLVVGKTLAAEHATMVRVTGRAEVWQVHGELHDLFDKSADDWRDRTIAAFPAHHAERIEISAPDGSRIALRKTGAGAGPSVPWEVVESSVEIAKLDSVVANQLVDTMASLKASSFADRATAAASGLQPPALTVTVSVTGGQTASLHIGKRGGDDEFFVMNPDLAEIFLVKAAAIERLNRRPIQFRDKTLCDINDADVTAFAVTRGSDSYAVIKERGAWKATHPAGLAVSSQKMATFSTVFRRWTAPEIAEAPPAGAVSAPRVVIVGRSRNASCTIQVGGEPADKPGYYVRTPRSRDVYIVPKWMIDRIAVKLDEITKA